MRRQACLLAAALALLAAPALTQGVDVQALLEAGKGGVVQVPAGTHVIDDVLTIDVDGTRLVGNATIVQSNPEAGIIHLKGARDVSVEGLVLTRPEGKMVTPHPGILAEGVDGLSIQRVTVRDNHCRHSAIRVIGCEDARIDSTNVINYKDFSLDDRTRSPDLGGFAFLAIDGEGITVRQTARVRISGCKVAEYRVLPTRELAAERDLGKVVDGALPLNVSERSKRVVQNGRVQLWHQGAGIAVVGSGANADVQLIGNRVLNAAQGFDIHADRVVCMGNSVENAMIGIKLTHGDRDAIVRSNVVTGADLWGLLVNAGALSDPAKPATAEEPAKGPNVDRGIILAHNNVADIGHGNEWWVWDGSPDSHLGTYAIAMFEGQMPDDPPVRDVLVLGNIVHDPNRDGLVAEDGSIEHPDPRHRFALYVGRWHEGGGSTGAESPRDIMVRSNILAPGNKGVSNVPVPAN